MLAMPGMRGFAVAAAPSADAVSCNAQGVFIGHVPLLEKLGGRWTPRRVPELNDELTACYRLPICISAKTNALSLIAAALNRGDLAMVAIAAVQMQLPDPPGLAKGVEHPDGILRRARELACSGLLKVWDPEKHPRTGTPPNPGEFALVHGSEEQNTRVAVRPGPNPWTEFPDAEGGGGGSPSRPGSSNPGPEEPPSSQPAPAATPKWTPPDPKTKLPFMNETEPQLAPREDGPTWGILKTGETTLELRSGYDGPALNMPEGSAGFDGVTLGHVEGHAAALMRQMGINEATLEINNPDICVSCEKNLPSMLPPGSTLHVVLPNGSRVDFHGVGP